jgi:hypothetical protein
VTAHLVRVDSDAYHSEAYASDNVPRLSSSMAGILISQSPLHCWARHPRLGNLGGKPATKAMDTGTLVHALVLGAGKSVLRCEFADWRTKDAQRIRDDARAAGLVPVLAADHDDAEKASLKIRQQLADRDIVLDGESEIAVEWEADTQDGAVLCRGMMDHLVERRGVIVDLKTSRDASPNEFAKSFVKHGYDIQWAAYTEALTTLHPELAGRTEMLFVVAEIEEPYAVAVYIPDGSMRELGMRRWDRACSTWARCLADGKWPGYDGKQRITPPRWTLVQEGIEP